MGRGSLAGWLRTVLSQRHIDRCRSQSRNVSLDEQLESGVSFAAAGPSRTPPPDERIAASLQQTFAELSGEERFLLASYFLDRQTLAAIGRQLCMHESTVSRKMDKLTASLRKRIRNRLLSTGMKERTCAEVLADLDVRDLQIDVAANLRQEKKFETF
jgi:RNA polymerase sigma-70 factor (ECF subfamily)